MVNSHQLVLEITQNLFKDIRFKGQEIRCKLFLSFIFCLSSFTLINAQEVSEQTNLKFQDLFFDALTQKAIHNYDTAIDNLDECNNLIPNEKSVLFELSKNYAFLNKRPEAIEFATQALQKEPENIWILEHLVSVYKVDRDFNQAIKIQKQIAEKHPKKKRKLVFLYLQNKDGASAKRVLNELASAKMLDRRLRQIKKKLEQSQTQKTTSKVKSTIVEGNVKSAYEKNKSFANLKSLLTKLDAENQQDFLKYSEEGLLLFPAQPLVYLMNGKALNKQKKYKKAVSSLKNGVDFILDDKKMEHDFYSEIIKAYQGLGDAKNVKKYKSKL